jgi:hypothetical protein
MTAIQMITGTVSGFVLVIDPNNTKSKFERVEYSDAAQMNAHVSRLNREQVADYNANLQNRNWDPTETLYCTLYRRDDNGEIEQENGFDLSGKTNVGDPAYKAVCKCGKTMRADAFQHLHLRGLQPARRASVRLLELRRLTRARVLTFIRT